MVLGLLNGGIIIVIRKFAINQSNSTFGADVMMGAGNASERFLGSLIIISACGASEGGTNTLCNFLCVKKSIAAGAILGTLFPIDLPS